MSVDSPASRKSEPASTLLADVEAFPLHLQSIWERRRARCSRSEGGI